MPAPIPDERVVEHVSVIAYGSDADDDGIIVSAKGPVPAGVIWYLERIALFTSDGIVTTVGTIVFRLFSAAIDASSPTSLPAPNTLREGTPLGSFGIADESSPIRFEQSESLLFRWNGLTVITGHAWASAHCQVAVCEVLPQDFEDPGEPESRGLMDDTPPPPDTWN